MLTDDLVKRSNGLLEIVAEGQGSSYSCFNDAGVECEVGEFLYGLVRLVRPLHIVETGTHVGVSAAYMGQALHDNNYGVIETIEYEQRHWEQAKNLFQTLGLDRVGALNMPSMNYVAKHPIDILFLDTEPQIRFEELERFYEAVVPGGFILIHDTPRDLCQGNKNPDHPEVESWPFGNLPPILKRLVRQDKLRVVQFPNPRGMAMFYKTHANDHKWR